MMMSNLWTVAGLLTATFLAQTVFAVSSAHPKLDVLGNKENAQASAMSETSEEKPEMIAFDMQADPAHPLAPYYLANQAESNVPPLMVGLENPNKAASSNVHQVIERRFFKDYLEVIANLHSEVEAETELVYLVNTSDKRNSCVDLKGLSIPNQHMIMVQRIARDVPMFMRQNGRIVGINPAGAKVAVLAKTPAGINFAVTPRFVTLSQMNPASETAFIPVSTGTPGGNRILTYSGIFRINERRTNDMRKSTNTSSDPMQNSVYINGEYTEGREARLALHGTMKKAWDLLGVSRASSGCIRLHTDFSVWNQRLLFDREHSAAGNLIPRSEFSGEVHVWNRRDHYPPSAQEYRSLPRAQKLKVLVVFFDGSAQSCS